MWLFVRRSRSGRTDLGRQNSCFAIEKLIPNQSDFILNGTHLGPAKLHVAHSKGKTGPASGLGILSNLFILNNLAERVGSEFTRKRSFNNMERSAGTLKQLEGSGKQC